jgi:predicted deacylase
MAQHYPIEVAPPDIKPYRQGNTGVDYVHVLDSGRPGANVMVQALTHGNELCGAIALDYLFKEKFRPAQGKLTLSFANVAAFERFDFDDPDRSRCQAGRSTKASSIWSAYRPRSGERSRTTNTRRAAST